MNDMLVLWIIMLKFMIYEQFNNFDWRNDFYEGICCTIVTFASYYNIRISYP